MIIFVLQVINIISCLIMELFTDAELEDIQRYNLDGYLSTVEDLLQPDPASIVSLRLISVIWRALRDFKEVSAPSSNSVVLILSSLTLGASLVPVGYIAWLKIWRLMSRRPTLDDVPLAKVMVEDGKFEDAAEPKAEVLEVKQEGLGRDRGRV